jgi:hypothetical protein
MRSTSTCRMRQIAMGKRVTTKGYMFGSVYLGYINRVSWLPSKHRVVQRQFWRINSALHFKDSRDSRKYTRFEYNKCHCKICTSLEAALFDHWFCCTDLSRRRSTHRKCPFQEFRYNAQPDKSRQCIMRMHI